MPSQASEETRRPHRRGQRRARPDEGVGGLPQRGAGRRVPFPVALEVSWGFRLGVVEGGCHSFSPELAPRGTGRPHQVPIPAGTAEVLAAARP